MTSSNDPISAAELLKQHTHTFEAYWPQILEGFANVPPRLTESIRYSFAAGGKRLRPALVIECARTSGGLVENPSVLAAAVAIELIHTFSLVHDDLPAMDDDDLRRGRPTNHKVFGEAMAILAGDAMVAMAFEILAAHADLSIAPKLIVELARATGPEGMIGGQVLDMEGESKALSITELQMVHLLKTGALLTAACRMGAIGGGGASNDQLQAVTRYGQHLGLAFQITDDLLDVTSTPQQLGKATNKDVAKGKNTYPSLIGLDRSRAAAQAEVASAISAVEPLGSSALGLQILAKFVGDRQV